MNKQQHENLSHLQREIATWADKLDDWDEFIWRWYRYTDLPIHERTAVETAIKPYYEAHTTCNK